VEDLRSSILMFAQGNGAHDQRVGLASRRHAQNGMGDGAQRLMHVGGSRAAQGLFGDLHRPPHEIDLGWAETEFFCTAGNHWESPEKIRSGKDLLTSRNNCKY
jgi:hypothetical protein